MSDEPTDREIERQSLREEEEYEGKPATEGQNMVALSAATKKRLKEISAHPIDEKDELRESQDEELLKPSKSEPSDDDLFAQLKEREELVNARRRLRRERARVRRMELENALEQKFEPVTYRLRILPYSSSVRTALNRASKRATRFTTQSRANYLRKKYGIKPSQKQSQKKKVVLTLE